nr:hypothetical protein [uncultured Tolumonas sp.]
MNETVKYEIISTSIISEVDRARDWPLKILSFTSAIHFGVIIAIISTPKTEFLCSAKIILTVLFSILMIWTTYYFYRCHISYLKIRNAQRKFQLTIGVKDGEIYPEGWLQIEPISGLTRFWGWGYYAFIAISFWATLVVAIWFPVIKSSA